MPNGTLLDSQFYLIYMSDGRDTKSFTILNLQTDDVLLVIKR